MPYDDREVRPQGTSWSGVGAGCQDAIMLRVDKLFLIIAINCHMTDLWWKKTNPQLQKYHQQ